MSFSSVFSFLMAPKIWRDDQRRQAQRRLVEQEQARAAHQRARDREHLLLAAGERAAALVDALLEARKQREYAFEIGSKMRGAGNRGAHLQVLQHCHPHEDAAAFRRLRDFQPRDLVRGKPRDVAAGEGDVPFAARGLPKIVIISVDLPAPLAPISATISPSPTSTSTPLRAAIWP